MSFAITAIILTLGRCAGIAFICWLVAIHRTDWLVLVGVIGILMMGASVEMGSTKTKEADQ